MIDLCMLQFANFRVALFKDQEVKDRMKTQQYQFSPEKLFCQNILLSENSTIVDWNDNRRLVACLTEDLYEQ